MRAIPVAWRRWPDLASRCRRDQDAAVVRRGRTAAVNTVAWSPDGTKVATTSDDFTAQIWDVATGRACSTYRNHTDKVWDIVVVPDGKRILSASRDMTA